MDSFKAYCDKWQLTVDVENTKVVVFKKCRNNRNLVFKYNETVAESVDNFNFLGVVLTEQIRTCINATNILSCKALRALGALMAL